MPITFTLTLALTITIVVYLLNKILPFRVCPVCAGVSMSWFLISFAVWLGLLPFSQYQLIIAILMGGTTVGIANQAEKKFPKFADNIFLFKIPIIFGGFLLAYWGVSRVTAGSLLTEAIILATAAYALFAQRNNSYGDSGLKNKKTIEKLEEEMEKCC